jgi:hypothetical protein
MPAAAGPEVREQIDSNPAYLGRYGVWQLGSRTAFRTSPEHEDEEATLDGEPRSSLVHVEKIG